MADSPLWKRVKERAKTVGKSAIDDLLASEESSSAVGAAVRRVQESRAFIDENASRLLGVLGLATQADLERVSKKVGRLRKRMTALIDRLG
ncbi:MAG: hypothetical protein ACAI38_00880 [Myxococcota bacterium]|nr:hypothetical protein [Myxococcota bacterium]